MTVAGPGAEDGNIEAVEDVEEATTGLALSRSKDDVIADETDKDGVVAADNTDDADPEVETSDISEALYVTDEDGEDDDDAEDGPDTADDEIPPSPELPALEEATEVADR